MDLSMFTRRTIGLLALTGAVLALALAAMLGVASHSAQAKTRSHSRHAVTHHRASAAESPATTEAGSRSESDGPGGPNVQSGNQSGPDNQAGADTEKKSSEGETSGTEADGPGGANTGGNCTGNCNQ